MAMYHFHCNRCKNDFYVTEHMGHLLDRKYLSCPQTSCRSRSLALRAYSSVDDARILDLAQRVDDLEGRLAAALSEEDPAVQTTEQLKN